MGARFEHAVVMGGSLAGLLAARVLTDTFARVTLVERDALPDGAVNRRGVPQGVHTHGLLAGGSRALEQLFPGFARALVDDGALPGDIVRDFRWFFEGAPLARPTSGMDGLIVSRPFLEAAIRCRVRALPTVTTCEATQVSGLVTTAGGGRVTGVTLADGRTLAADLVVDATGRGSRTPQWLTAAGYAPPREERIEIGLGYTTRLFRREPRHLDGDLGTVVPPTPHGKRGGVMAAQEGGRWTVTLISHFVPPAPTDLEGFRHFAAALPSPDIHEVIRDAEPIGEPLTSRFPASVRRRYEKLWQFPERLVVIGDAICSFNPIYGQGMSVAALEALALGEVLRDGLADVGPRFFKHVAPIVDTPWTTAAGNDLRMPEAVGPRSPISPLVNAYITRLQRRAQVDAELAVTFMRVTNMIAPPTDLFAPRTIWRVLRSVPARPQSGPVPTCGVATPRPN